MFIVFTSIYLSNYKMSTAYGIMVDTSIFIINFSSFYHFHISIYFQGLRVSFFLNFSELFLNKS